MGVPIQLNPCLQRERWALGSMGFKEILTNEGHHLKGRQPFPWQSWKKVFRGLERYKYKHWVGNRWCVWGMWHPVTGRSHSLARGGKVLSRMCAGMLAQRRGSGPLHGLEPHSRSCRSITGPLSGSGKAPGKKIPSHHPPAFFIRGLLPGLGHSQYPEPPTPPPPPTD